MAYLYSSGKKITCGIKQTTSENNVGITGNGEGCNIFPKKDKEIPYLSIIKWNYPKWNLPDQYYSLEIEYTRVGK